VTDASAYQTAELAAVYDAVHAGRDDTGFWVALAAAGHGGVLDLACGTGRTLLPLARAGHDVTGVDLSERMLDVCRAKLADDPPEVRERVRLVAADMTTFELGRRYSLVAVPFASFQHLLTVDQQLACLERCRKHLAPGGRLVLDLPNPAPAPLSAGHEAPAAEAEAAEVVEWTGGRRIQWWASMREARPSLQQYTFEATYEIRGAGGTVRRLHETYVLRYVFRYELEHLLHRAGFGIAALYGDYDRSHFADGSPAMIAVAQAADCTADGAV
jgi:SAM-dependent methyltransferase